MRIAISQRVEDVERHAERRDALDQRWARRIEALGSVAVPVPNGLHDIAAWASSLDIEALLLSGGNDLAIAPDANHPAPERDHTEFALLGLARSARWPVLGVCRGMQTVNVYLGGQIERVSGHVAKPHPVYRTPVLPRRLVGFPDGVVVNSFHGFGIRSEGLAPGFEPVLLDADGHVEAAEHTELPWTAVMWHPERDPPPPSADDWLRHIFK